MNKVARAGVGILILRDDKVLLGRRNPDPKKADSELGYFDCWTCPGGKLEFGEKIIDAAKKELIEETGVKAKDLDVISVSNEIVSDNHFVTIGFLCRKFGGEPKVMEPDEIIEWKWFPIKELPEPIYPPSFKLINNYLEGKIYKGD